MLLELHITSSCSDLSPLSREAFYCECHFDLSVLWLLCCVKPSGSSMSALFRSVCSHGGLLSVIPAEYFGYLGRWIPQMISAAFHWLTLYDSDTKCLQIVCVLPSPGRSLSLWYNAFAATNVSTAGFHRLQVWKTGKYNKVHLTSIQVTFIPIWSLIGERNTTVYLYSFTEKGLIWN